MQALQTVCYHRHRIIRWNALNWIMSSVWHEVADEIPNSMPLTNK